MIKDRLKEIDKSIPIIIIENSKDLVFKTNIEKEYDNVKVIIPNENLGFGKAVNIGIREAKTKMVFLTQPDVKLIDNCISKLIECIKEFDNFSVLTPYDKNDELFKNYEIYNKYINTSDKDKFYLEEVDYVDLTWLINKDKFDEEDLWDENIFLYFEAKDFAKRLKNKGKKIFVSKAINTYHIGASSHDMKLDYYSKINRNWHYNWSRFYFNKKHLGTYYAYKKGLSCLIKILFRLIKRVCTFKIDDIKFILPELNGLIASMLGKKSYYRPYEKIKSFK